MLIQPIQISRGTRMWAILRPDTTGAHYETYKLLSLSKTDAERTRGRAVQAPKSDWLSPGLLAKALRFVTNSKVVDI